MPTASKNQDNQSNQKRDYKAKSLYNPFFLFVKLGYKSNTEVLLARTKSFNRIQKANVKYTPNHNPAVTKVM